MRKSIRLTMLGALAALMVVGATAGRAQAYFTASTQAAGGVPINVKPETTITEEVDTQKKLTIHNTSTTVPVYLRARVFAGSNFGAKVTGGSNWSASGDWWNYDLVLEPGADTSVLTVDLQVPAAEDSIEGDNFNVVVVYEATPVTYDADGSALPADWTSAQTADQGE